MNRQEAIDRLKTEVKRIEEIMENGDCGCVDMDTWNEFAKKAEWRETLIELLSVPTPDPTTGLVPCNWCGPERIGWFSVQFWVRACYGKRKWMSVTQDWKKKVKYCPMCGRKLEVEE